MFDDLLTPAEALAYLRLDQQGLAQPREALRWLCRTGRLKFTKIGRYIRFRKAWLDEMIEKHAVQNSNSGCRRLTAEPPDRGEGCEPRT